MNFTKQITLAFTGASGAAYGLRLIQVLVQADYQIFVLVSPAARVVLVTEEDKQVPANPKAIVGPDGSCKKPSLGKLLQLQLSLLQLR